ncbi:MAG: thioredoxin family protein [Alphaproteobacteria bacterium]|nr:thioredoxin family protein [Alphaproteobacteria bacterium]
MALTHTPICAFGWKAVDFRLPGIDGKTYGLADVQGPKATLVMFLCNHCPYVKAAIDRIVRDARELEGHGVGTVAIMPNDVVAYPDDSFENMKVFAKAHAFPFPYLIDETQATARAYDAICTPDFFGFNQALELQYRGRVDEGGREEVPGARRELFEAMVAIAETGAGPATQVASMGCSIKWREGA